MSTPAPHARITNRRPVFLLHRAPESILLHIGDRFKEKPVCEQNHADDVARATEGDAMVVGDGRRVEDCDGEGDCPYPEHLLEC